MAAIQFPNNPNAGDLFVASNGIRYTYDGEKWKTLGTSTVGTEGQFLETPTVLTIDKVIPGNTNTGAVGPMAVGDGITLTVPASSTFRTLLGRTGALSSAVMPISGGTFTGPVYFSDDAIIKGNATDGSGELTLNCENNSHGIKIKGPPHSAGANYTLILPNDTGTSGQVLTTNGSGVSSWSSVLPITGGTLTGGLTGTTAIFSGNVGIGTSSPSSPLTVEQSSGNVNFELHSTSSGRGTQIKTHNDHATFFHGLAGDTTGEYIYYTADAKDHVFSTNNSERLRIDSSGALGLATSSPKANDGNYRNLQIGLAAHLYGRTDDSTLYLSSNFSRASSGWAYTANTTASLIALGTNIIFSNAPSGTAGTSVTPTERMRIDSSGRVGIGETTPADLLHIKSASGNANVRLTTGNTSSGYTALIFGDTSDTNTGAVQYDHSNDSLQIEVNNSERMRIDSSGRLLVGTTTVGEDYADELTIANNSNCGITIRSSSSTSGNLYFSDGTSGSAQYSGAIVYSHGTNSLKLFTNGGQERMRIDAGGDVAIGMTPAGKSLSIQHAANPTLGFYTGNTLRGELNITTGETSLRSYANSPITFEVGSERMRINSAGSLLVGTSTTSSFPDRLISVGHHTRASSYIDIRSSTVAALLFADGTSGDAAYRGQVEYHHSTDSMRFWTGANERMRIDSTGSVKVPGIYSQALSGTLRSVVARNDGYLGYNSSTRASKTNINSLDNINWLYQLNPVEFNYRKTDSETNAYTEENYEEKEYGLIAEEVETIAPDLCFYDETQEGEVLAGVHYRKMSALLLKAIQNLKADNETFQLRIAALEQRLSDAGIA